VRTREETIQLFAGFVKENDLTATEIFTLIDLCIRELGRREVVEPKSLRAFWDLYRESILGE
jgi:hypothetical protein